MKPPKGSGLEQLERLGKMLLSQYSRYTKYYLDKSNKINKSKPAAKKYTAKKRPFGRTPALPDPLDKLVRGLTTALSRLTKKTEVEDYNAIVKDFIPNDARTMKPLNPVNTEEFLSADLDGDSQNELVATFRQNDGIKTMILKKKNGQWYKAAEINNPEHDMVHYRNIADITGDGKKQLLLGMSSKGKAHSLYGYSLGDTTAKKLFTRSYHWAEIVNKPGSGNANAKKQLALWTRGENGAYDAEVLNWNGLQLEPLKDTVPYYHDRMVPYFIRKLKQEPQNQYNWYNLTNAMVKAEAYRDASVIADIGMKRVLDPALKDKFTSLRAEIMEKL